MSGTLTNITSNPRYDTYYFRVGDRKGKTYTGPSYRNYPRWSLLSIGDHVTGLKWKNSERGIIDADSPVKIAQAAML